jgi:flagellar motor switch protein FliN/FliY
MPSLENGTAATSREWLVAGWQEALQTVLSSLAGPEALTAVQFSVQPADAAAWEIWESSLWLRLALEAAPGGAITAGAPLETMQALGRWIAADPAATDDRCRETFQELISLAAAAAARQYAERLRRRTQFSPAQPAQAPAHPEHAFEVTVQLEGAAYPLALVASAELLQALEPPGVTEAAIPPVRPAEPARHPADGPSPAPGGPNLELLLEVELPVCVSFGRTQLPLKDVLKLSSGSIVELNRLVNEPVEVLINDSVIARGEVVVVDGNYGIRVTQIVSRQERIRSIF